MYNSYDETNKLNDLSQKDQVKIAIGATIVIAVIVVISMAFLPRYNVWRAQMAGKAKLAEANQSRQIKITEAKAKKESAIYEAEAEVERAKGMAKANQIVGDSLKGHENYLKYLYIQNMHQTQNQIIYVPTEGGIPILEAGIRK